MYDVRGQHVLNAVDNVAPHAIREGFYNALIPLMEDPLPGGATGFDIRRLWLGEPEESYSLSFAAGEGLLAYDLDRVELLITLLNVLWLTPTG